MSSIETNVAKDRGSARSSGPNSPRAINPVIRPCWRTSGRQETESHVTERDIQTTIDALAADPRYKARFENPFGEPSAPIALTDPSRECRWFNAGIASDHVWRAKRKGWDQVKPSQVADLEQIGGHNVSPDGYITRGERGQEVLMSMPKQVRAAIQAEKTRLNNRNMGNPNRTKQDIVEAAGNQIGAEAADYLNQTILPTGFVRDTKEIIQVDPE
jgi:hypothetical protein